MLTATIMELRTYARAKEMVDNAKSQSDLPSNPMIELVWEIQMERAREIRAERMRKHGGT